MSTSTHFIPSTPLKKLHTHPPPGPRPSHFYSSLPPIPAIFPSLPAFFASPSMHLPHPFQCFPATEWVRKWKASSDEAPVSALLLPISSQHPEMHSVVVSTSQSPRPKRRHCPVNVPAQRNKILKMQPSEFLLRHPVADLPSLPFHFASACRFETRRRSFKDF